MDGKIVAGAHGAGGEIGHACVDPTETAVCNCGNRGCLEQMASATGIVRLAKRYLATYQGKTMLNPERISAKSVYDALKAGDEAATALRDKFQELIAKNGTVEKVDDWGKRRLAYAINYETEGYYVVINHKSEPDFVAELSRVLNITDGVLRYLTVKKD